MRWICLGCLLFAACARFGYSAAPAEADGATGDVAAVTDGSSGGTETEVAPAHPPDAGGTPGEPPPPLPPGAILVDGSYDVCEAALTVDLAHGAKPVVLQIETASATTQYRNDCCRPPMTDVVVRLINIPSGPMISCTGGGNLGAGAGAAGCGGASSSCSSLPCDGSSSQTLLVTAAPAHIVFCRDPALGPATLTIN